MAISCVRVLTNLYSVSASNCARIYNMSLSSMSAHSRNNELAFFPSVHTERAKLPDAWPNQTLDYRTALDGFFLYSVLLDKAERMEALRVSHSGEVNRDRIKSALEERNFRMEGTGQEYWAHACDLCFIGIPGPDGRPASKSALVSVSFS